MISRFTIPVLLGVLAAGLAAMVTQLGMKFIVAFLGLLIGLSILLSIRDSSKIELLLVAGLAFAIPLNLDVHFLFRPHLGGAASIGISASMLCVIGLYVVWIYRYKTRQLSPLVVFDSNLIWASILFMCVGILSLWNARHADLVFLEEIRLVTFFLTMLVVMNFRSDKLLRVFVIFLAIAAFAQGSLASLQFVGNTSLGLDIFGEVDVHELNIGRTVTRATGTIGHPNVLGYYLEIMFPLVLALLLTERQFFLRLLYLAASASVLAGLVCTVSRGAWITVPFSCLIVFFVLHAKNIFRLNTAVAAAVLGLIMIVPMYLAFPTIQKRFTHDDGKSASMRMPLNYASFSIIQQYPVLGVGLNNFAETFHDYDTTQYSRRLTARRVVDGTLEETRYKQVVHNLVMWVWTEVGTLGLISFLWLFGAAVMVSIRSWRRADDWSRAVLLGCSTGFVAHFIHGMVDPGFRVTISVSMLLYSMFGLIGAIALRIRQGSLMSSKFV